MQEVHKSTSRTTSKLTWPTADPVSQLSGWRRLRAVCTWCSCSTGPEQLWKDLGGALKPVPRHCKALSRVFSPHHQWWSLKASRNTCLYLTYFTLQWGQWQVPSHYLNAEFIKSRHLWPPSSRTTHQQQKMPPCTHWISEGQRSLAPTSGLKIPPSSLNERSF